MIYTGKNLEGGEGPQLSALSQSLLAINAINRKLSAMKNSLWITSEDS